MANNDENSHRIHLDRLPAEVAHFSTTARARHLVAPIHFQEGLLAVVAMPAQQGTTNLTFIENEEPRPYDDEFYVFSAAMALKIAENALVDFLFQIRCRSLKKCTKYQYGT